MSTPLESPSLEGTTLTEERLASTDDGDHERFAHYVQKDKIVESAVALGRSLSMTTVAEGVETPETERWLATIGCDVAQGFLLGRPMDPAALGAWAQARGARPVFAA